MKAPFPWFGGKSRVADVVWQHFGDVPNYVEPFAGSLAVLLGRPHQARIETVNDKDGFVSNFWRAVSIRPDEVAYHADWPVNESDLTARHLWLVQRREDLTRRLEADPGYYDAKVAGYWVWGLCCWIGTGWCSGDGPWVNEGGLLTKRSDTDEDGVTRKIPNLTTWGGMPEASTDQLPHVSNAGQGVNATGVRRQLPHVGDGGRGVNRKLPHVGGEVNPLLVMFCQLQERLRYVRVCCGDWARILTAAPTTRLGLTGVFLDPPYASEDREDCYVEESYTVAHDVRAWALEHGDDPDMRIALCGYDGEHNTLEDRGWSKHHWSAHGGYANTGSKGNANRHREVIWFSPHCVKPAAQFSLALEMA